MIGLIVFFVNGFAAVLNVGLGIDPGWDSAFILMNTLLALMGLAMYVVEATL